MLRSRRVRLLKMYLDRILRLHFVPLTPCPRSGGALGGMLLS
jgi:hypothetical protein